MYNKKVIEIFQNPQNIGEIKGASGVGIVEDKNTYEIVKLSFNVNENGVIDDAKFKSSGCASTIASASMATTLLLNKSVDEAKKIKTTDILKLVGNLPESKMYSVIITKQAIDKALNFYDKKQARLNKQSKK